MIGCALLVAPVVYSGGIKVYFYLPNEDWYSLKTFDQVYYYQAHSKEGRVIELEDKFDYVNVLMKGGNIIPYQDAHTSKI